MTAMQAILEHGDVRDAFTNLRGTIDKRWTIEAAFDKAEELGQAHCLADFPGYQKAGEEETNAEFALIATILTVAAG